MAVNEKYLTYNLKWAVVDGAFKTLAISGNTMEYKPYDGAGHVYLSLFNSDGTYAATGLRGTNY